VAEIGAHKNEASNLLKLNCKINDKLVGCFLDLGVTNLFMTLQMMKQLGIKTELMANPIMLQLAQGITRPSFSVMLRIELFCKGI